MSLVKGTAASTRMEEYFFSAIAFGFVSSPQIVGMLSRYSD